MAEVADLLMLDPSEWESLPGWNDIHARATSWHSVWRRLYSMPPTDPRYLEATDSDILIDLQDQRIQDLTREGTLGDGSAIDRIIRSEHKDPEAFKTFVEQQREAALSVWDHVRQFNEDKDGR